MSYYARREKRRKAIQRQLDESMEKDPLVRLANNARDVAIITMSVTAALFAIGVLQRTFWIAFREEHP